MSTVNIEGLTPGAALAALYNASKPQGMGFLQFDPTPMTETEATAVLDGHNYVDYYKGRIIKVDFPKDAKTIESRLYDRDNGDGAARRAIDAWRRQHGKAA